MAELPGDLTTTLQVVRKRRFAMRLTGVEELIRRLMAEGFRGQIRINLGKGGVQSVVAEDHQGLDSPST